MDTQRAAEELKVIRQLMERPVRYSTQSGLAGIIAGLAAVAGLCVDLYNWSHSETHQEAMERNMLVWAGVLVVAVAGVLVLTRIRERRQSMPLWSPIKARIARTVLPPCLAGIALTFATVHFFLQTGHIEQGYLIPTIWMVFYGLACWQLGEFSVREVRWLGAAFLLAGVVTAFVFQGYPGLLANISLFGLPGFLFPYIALGVSFGGFHILYGIVVCIRHGG